MYIASDTLLQQINDFCRSFLEKRVILLDTVDNIAGQPCEPQHSIIKLFWSHSLVIM